jgi:shikimate kinase
MGSGKTTVGTLLANRLNWAFADTDVVIEQNTGCDIPTLFQEKGEALFRDIEAQAVQKVCAENQQVIATGGGTVLRPENIELLRERCWVVWLTARPDVVLERTGSDASVRPVLAQSEGTPLAHILRLLGERGPCYRIAADIIVDTSDREPPAVVEEILLKWERQGGSANA